MASNKIIHDEADPIVNDDDELDSPFILYIIHYQEHNTQYLEVKLQNLLLSKRFPSAYTPFPLVSICNR